MVSPSAVVGWVAGLVVAIGLVVVGTAAVGFAVVTGVTTVVLGVTTVVLGVTTVVLGVTTVVPSVLPTVVLTGVSTVVPSGSPTVVVTSVSPWHQQWLSQYNDNTHLIYNGYDEDTFVPKNVVNEVFQISYLGKLYSIKLRDPRLLFEALRQLIEEKKIEAKTVQVLFHTDPAAIHELQELAETYGIREVVNIQGYVPRSQILDIMHESSILLVLTTQSTPEGTHGIMGTKFFENIGVEKPILCVRSDEECLAQTITDTHAGLAATQVEEVKAFVMDKYQEWQHKGYTRQAVVNKERFTRQCQAQQFEKLFLACIP